MSLVVWLSFLHSKHLLMELSFENEQFYANLSLGLFLANYSHFQYVNLCQSDSIRAGILIKRRVDAHLKRKTPVASKVRSRLIINEPGLKVSLKASIQRAGPRNWTASVLMVFVLLTTPCLKLGVVVFTVVPVRRHAHFSLIRTANVVVRRERAGRIETKLHLRIGICSYWHMREWLLETVQHNQHCCTTNWREIPIQRFTCSWTTIWKLKERNHNWLRSTRRCIWKLESQFCLFCLNFSDNLCYQEWYRRGIEDYFFKLRKFCFRLSRYRLVHWSFLSLYFILIWLLILQKYTSLLTTLHHKAGF